ncbi:D-methionine transport system ATP-binding protein [Lentibacillus halodurans]|uniref:D-methionine transport system ATP-binding protein n=1 Tax=Lentibacillus halodurans TaxID=237679 RepID=A0A1I0ZZA0_9BACI|nr:methionine ABC transporter ATP-binding protein [Lentibacillus halodurans]SFB31065.1 D-methionine transport system ATP-binding protein [Lentibacillus halodurans]
MITFENVTKIYESAGQQVKALDEVDLHIEEGEIYGVIGFSGAGKSSLVRCVNLLERPTSGNVIVNNQNLQCLSPKELREAKRHIGMIFQHFNLLNSKTVFTNVAMPLLLMKQSKKEVEQRVYELLEFVGLRDKAADYPDQLSGGQKQRVGIARALATQPSVLLCDEATSALDPQTTESILKLLKRINQAYNITILIITHEMGVIREICDKVAVLDQGKVIESGSVFEVFAQPKTEIAHDFVSTVMQDDIPESVHQLIQSQSSTNRIYRIVFVGDSAGAPLLSQIAKRFDVEVNVLFGSITELQGTPFGNLIVKFEGDAKEINRVIMDINQQEVTVKEVLEDAG